MKTHCYAIWFNELHEKSWANSPFWLGMTDNVVSVGGHIRFCQIQRKMTQRQIAELIGVTMNTITNWELNRSVPMKSYMFAIVEFLDNALLTKENKP